MLKPIAGATIGTNGHCQAVRPIALIEPTTVAVQNPAHQDVPAALWRLPAGPAELPCTRIRLSDVHELELEQNGSYGGLRHIQLSVSTSFRQEM